MAQNMTKFSQSGQWNRVAELPEVLMHCLKDEAPENVKVTSRFPIKFRSYQMKHTFKFNNNQTVYVFWEACSENIHVLT
eukprot:UN17265